MDSGGTPTRATKLCFGAGALLLAAGLALRALPARRWTPPERDPATQLAFPAPTQLLSARAGERGEELARLMGAERGAEFLAAWRALPGDCPAARDWLAGTQGQSVQRACARLQQGDSAQALGALALCVAVARRTEWEPDGFGAGRSLDADAVASLFEAWIVVRGEQGADDPLLAEASVYALLGWARLMHEVEAAPFVLRDRDASLRAAARIEAWLGGADGRRTRLGASLAERHPQIGEALQQRRPLLGLLDAAARRWAPELDGECGS